MLQRLDFAQKTETMKILFKDAKSDYAVDTVSHNFFERDAAW